jgi:response regulator RpfG family c-di-GMP phosphodiesterase
LFARAPPGTLLVEAFDAGAEWFTAIIQQTMKDKSEGRIVSPGKTKKQLSHLRPEKAVAALAVSCHEEDLAFLRGVFDSTGWTLYEAPTLTKALILLKRRPVDLIITDRDLTDGCWRGLLDALKPLAAAPPLIVTSRLADEYLWAEVLNEGGYDVLAQPFESEEVVRVISAATRRGHNATFEARRPDVFLPAGA